MALPRPVVVLLSCLVAVCPAFASDPLPSWNDTPTKAAIMDFVDRVTDEGSADFVPIPERIATFDNDGNLWAEQPVYFQLFFAVDRVKAMAADHSEWATEEPFASVLAGDLQGVLANGEKALVELIMATHTGLSSEEFAHTVKIWTENARHPETGRLYTEMVYQPMLELLDYLRANDFKTFIVSGGGIEFMRPWTEAVYGIPPEQVVGSSVKTEYALVDGEPAILRLPEINFIDDKAGKPVGINQHIGRRPIFASGNSDGDFQMLEYTTAGRGARFGLLLHHTDAEREWAYDRNSHIGRLDRGLDEADERGWVVIDMAEDWNTIWPELDD